MSGRSLLAENNKQGLSGCIKTQGEKCEVPWRLEGEIALPQSSPDDARVRAWPRLTCLMAHP